jgi:transcriptional regulator with XRE-family HTH domain
MRNHLGNAIYHERTAQRMTQDALASRLGISHAGLNRLENQSRRPDTDTLPRLCHGWPDNSAGIRVAIEHLRDEWQRCGLPDGAVSIRSSKDNDLEHAFETMRAIRLIDRSVYDHLLVLMDSIVTASGGVTGRMLAADGSGPDWQPTPPRKPKNLKTPPQPEN